MRKSLSLLVLFLLCGTSVLLVTIPAIKEAHASGPTIVNSITAGALVGSGSTTVAQSFSVTSGDEVFVLTSCVTDGGSCTATNSLTNSLSDGFTYDLGSAGSQVNWSCFNGGTTCYYVLAHFTASATGTVTITATWAAFDLIAGWSAYDVNGGAVAYDKMSTGSTSAETGGSFAVGSYTPSTGGLVGTTAIVGCSATQTFTAGASYGLTSYQPQFTGLDFYQVGEYSNSFGGTATTSPFTSSSSVCKFSEMSVDYAPPGVTEVITSSTSPAGASSATIGISGCSVSNSTYTADGHAHTYTGLTPSCQITLTAPGTSGNARTVWHGVNTTITFNTVSSGSGTQSHTVYSQLQNTYAMAPGVPAIWDAGYTEHASGTVLGTGSTSVCTITLVSSGGSANCTGWADYDLAVSTVTSFASSVSGSWTATGTRSWTDTTGGNTHSATYDLEAGAFILSYSISGGGSPTAPTLLCNELGTPTNTSLTTSPTNYPCDSGTTWHIGHNPLYTSSSSQRWYTSQTLTGTVGVSTTVYTFYHQYNQTFKYTQTCEGGATCYPPFLEYHYLGAYPTNVTEAKTAQWRWMDAGTTALISSPILDSYSEAYPTTPTSWSISAANVVGNPSVFSADSVITICMSYKQLDGGYYNAPILTYVDAGFPSTLTLTGSVQCVSATPTSDWNVTNPLTGLSASSQERAYSTNTTSGAVSMSFNETLVYWHQLYIAVSYTLSDAAATNHPSINLTQFGAVNEYANSKTPFFEWADYASPWTATKTFVSTPDFQTWTARPAAGQILTPDPDVYYSMLSSCGGSNPLTLLENSCLIPAILLTWSAPIGLGPWFAFILLGVNVAIYNKTQSVAIALTILLVSGGAFGYLLPVYIGAIANIFLYVGGAGVLVRAIIYARGG